MFLTRYTFLYITLVDAAKILHFCDSTWWSFTVSHYFFHYNLVNLSLHSNIRDGVNSIYIMEIVEQKKNKKTLP